MGLLDKLLGSVGGGSDSESKLPKISDEAGQPNDEIKLVSYIKEKVQEVRNSGSRVSHEGTWMTNYAYLMGYDSVYYDTSSRQYRVVGKNNSTLRRDRIHVNKILPTVQRRQARLCKNAPRFEVRPDDASQDARDKARLEEQWLQMYIEKEHFLEKRLRMMPGLMQCGHYYMGVSWNTEKGKLIEATDDAGEPDYEYEGDVEVELVSPFEIFADPLATTLEDAQWIVRAKVRKLDYFRSHYPERGELVKEEGAWLLSVQYELRIQSLTGQGPSQTGVQTQMNNAAIELAYYEKRSKKHPKGRMVVVANGILLCDKELPVGDIPFAKFDDIPITDKYYSEAIVTHLRPIQDQYNKVISKRAAWTNKMLAGKWMAAKGSGLMQETLNDSSGEIVYYNPVPNAAPPSMMQVPVIPSYAYQEEDKLNQMFYDIAGEGDISRGVLPSAGIPAIGMQLLLEQDETRIGAMTEQHEHASARVFKLMLMYGEKFTSNDRLLKITDPNSQYLIKKYSGNDLKSEHDVIVNRGSLAPASKAVKRNDIMNLYQSGLIGDPQDPQTRARVLNYLEFGDVATVWSDQAIDLTQVKKTIEQIEKGITPEVSEFDNHALHLQEKNKYRKSDKFSLLDTYNQALLINDMEEHLQALMKITAPQFGMTPDAKDEVDTRQQSLLQGAIPEGQAGDQLNSEISNRNPDPGAGPQ